MSANQDSMKIKTNVLNDNCVKILILPYMLETYSKNTKQDIDVAIIEALHAFSLSCEKHGKGLYNEVSSFY